MSFLDKLCGRKKEKTPSTEDAIQQLREMERLLETKQEYLERKVEGELRLAKLNGIKNKRLALQALKRKRRYEKQLQQIDGTLATIEMQREALEGVHTNTTVLKTMKLAADALKNAHRTMDVDKVHDMMDDIAEQQDIAKEITEAVSNPSAFAGCDVDEEELERELEELNQQILDSELLDAGPSPISLPHVPNEKIQEQVADQQKSEEDEDLEKLMQWAT